MTPSRTFLFFVLILYFSSVPAVTYAAEDVALWSAKYDKHFKKYSRRYFGPYFDWHWFKAQAITESGLDSQARSHKGAFGVMQIMPTTFEEIQDARPHLDDIKNARWNIAAGIYYTRVLYDRLKEHPEEDRLKFAFASYNAGLSAVRKAMRRTDSKDKTWETVSPQLPLQTRNYVNRILKIMGKSRHRD